MFVLSEEEYINKVEYFSTTEELKKILKKVVNKFCKWSGFVITQNM
jgi:hypothetical protein